MSLKKFINSASEQELLYLRDRTAEEIEKQLASPDPDYLLVGYGKKVIKWVEEELQAMQNTGEKSG